MCTTTFGTLTLAAMLDDPLIQAVRRSDRVSEAEYVAMLFRVKDSLAERGRRAEPARELTDA